MSDPITDEDIKNMVTEAINNVFSTMLSIPISLNDAKYCSDEIISQSKSPPLNPDQPKMLSSVGFTGAINGVIYITVSESLSMELTCGFLEMDPEEVMEEGLDTVDDTMGELANMIGGGFKNKLCDMGFQCMLTLPSVLRGNNFKIQSNKDDKSRRHNYDFQTCSSSLIFDLIFKHTN